MRNENVWEVDRMAAVELLALLKEAPEADWSVIAAKAFSGARLKSYDWAAKRVHESAIKVLEQEAAEMFQRKDPVWTDGFRHAEECLIAASSSELLAVIIRPPRSKGQVLRSFLRSAKPGKTTFTP